MLRLLGRSVTEGFKGIFRHGLMSLASVGTVAVSLLVLAVFLVVAVNLSYVADVLESQVEVVVYLNPDFDRQWRDLLMEKVNDIQGVRKARFVSKEEALEILKEQFGSQAELLEAVEEDNPLRDSVEIGVHHPDDIEGVVVDLEEIESVQEVVYQRDVVNRIYSVTDSLRKGGMGLVFFLSVATFLLISNTIRLTVHARREEIEVMRLVGASSGYVWGPLVVEGLILGLIGAGIAGGVIAWGYMDLVSALQSSLPFLPLVRPLPFVKNLLMLLLACGAALGLISSWFSAWRYAREV